MSAARPLPTRTQRGARREGTSVTHRLLRLLLATALAGAATLSLAACASDDGENGEATAGGSPALPDAAPPSEAPASVPGAPTWHTDVQPVIEAYCTTCHRDGGSAPFALTDYAAVAAWLKEECARREWRLLETLAEDLAAGLLSRFPRVRAVTLQIHKFVLPKTRDVSVTLRREQS